DRARAGTRGRAHARAARRPIAHASMTFGHALRAGTAHRAVEVRISGIGATAAAATIVAPIEIRRSVREATIRKARRTRRAFARTRERECAQHDGDGGALHAPEGRSDPD